MFSVKLEIGASRSPSVETAVAIVSSDEMEFAIMF
jgi:hypothetical protein